MTRQLPRCAAVWLALTVLLPGTASAHDRRVSAARVVLDSDGFLVTFRVRQIDLTSLSPAAATWAHDAAGNAPEDVVTALVGLYRATTCRLVPGSVLTRRAQAAEVAISWRMSCEDVPVELHIAPYPAVGHLHVATIEQAPRGPSDESAAPVRVVVSDRARVVSLAGRAASAGEGSPTALAYLGHGFTHAITGWDHIVFVLLLVLLSARLRRAALLTTGFTLGHSVTLGVAAVGWLQVDGHAVEALIAASIVGMAAENMTRTNGTPTASRGVALLSAVLGLASGVMALLPAAAMIALAAEIRGTDDPSRSEGASAAPGLRTPEVADSTAARFGLATCFGMIHGLGFSTGLDVSGPGLLGRLLAFNAGVEVAQLVVVVVAFVVLRTAAGWFGRRGVAVVCSWALGCVGAFASVSRAFG